MAEAAVLKSNNASKKRKSDGLGGSKNKRSLASTSTSKISETFEDSLSSLLMSNVPTSEYTDAIYFLLSVCVPYLWVELRASWL